MHNRSIGVALMLLVFSLSCSSGDSTQISQPDDLLDEYSLPGDTRRGEGTTEDTAGHDTTGDLPDTAGIWDAPDLSDGLDGGEVSDVKSGDLWPDLADHGGEMPEDPDAISSDGDPEPETVAPFPYGELCETDDDCEGGHCLATALGKVCTTPCAAECPEDWQCWLVGDGDLCMPPEVHYCTPCDPSVPADHPLLHCVELWEEVVVLIECAEDESCGWGLVCVERDGGLKLCEPPSGTCECLPDDPQNELLCPISNEWGLCLGWTVCLGEDGLGECAGPVPKQEVCNGEDDDCDGQIDESALNCAPVFCLQEGLSFYVKGAQVCSNGTCQDSGETAPCGLYGCDKIGATGTCLTQCEDDSDCVAGAFCSADELCVLKQGDGGLCDDDKKCISGHCNHGICCQFGVCCFTAPFCPAEYAKGPFCDDPMVCQGHRQDPDCVNFMCQAGPNVPDDSGCDENHMANDCGAFPPVYCNGLEKQVPPGCAAGCDLDGDCEVEAHCDDICVPDLDDGLSCDEDSDCASAHCQNGLCCGEGYCCDEDADCLEDFAAPPICDEPGLCQGFRIDAWCENNTCHSTAPIDDDSECTSQVQADPCGHFLDVFCNGDSIQSSPLCPEACGTGAQCDEGYTCKASACVAQKGDAKECDVDTDCTSGHCANGFCCIFGDCCAEAVDCPPQYTVEPFCQNAATCQGFRMDPVCEGGMCGSIGPIDDDTACEGGLGPAVECAPYPDLYCTGQTAQLPPVCASLCDVDGDCKEGAHCDGTCVEDLPDGYSCDENTDCVSGHCSMGVCCAAGDCCIEAGDCPPVYSAAPSCEMAEQCQGFRIDALCESHQCGSTDTLSDDSGCGEDILATECGLYLPLFCDGKKYQMTPQCPLSCKLDSDCIAGHHCDGTCVGDKSNGAVCDENSDCISGHCANGFCCDEGTCCLTSDTCPAQFSASPVCEQPGACQGSRVDVTCESYQCDSVAVDDDTSCTVSQVVDDCGLYVAVTCDGTLAQETPTCPVGCVDDGDCDPGTHCDGTCLLDLAGGQGCDEDGDCSSGYCANGFCCGAGVCCAVPIHCPAEFWEDPTCDDEATCQGVRVDAACEDFQCTTQVVEDDSACSLAVLADDCGPFPDIYCDGSPAQSVPECSMACDGDPECAADYHCDGICRPDKANGLSCDEDSDCQSDHCTNGFCCDSGDCCQFNYHCPDEYDSPATCDTQPSCQGSRQDRKCSNFICTSQNLDDDTDCVEGSLALTCGLFLDQYCNGQAWQVPAACPANCTWDSECKAQAHCDGICLEDLQNGQLCDESSDCISSLCSNGICTGAGVGCNAPADCPAQFSEAPMCDDDATCQGTRVDATCQDHQCGSSTVEDDSACEAQTVADECGYYPARYCTGAPEQDAPACPDACLADGECDAGAHCDGICLGDLADGDECDENSDCLSAHCNNGLCCTAGDCCLDTSGCPAEYTTAPVCTSLSTCQGHRIDAHCTGNVCGSTVVGDDSACAADMMAGGCGAWLPLFCSGEAEQEPPQCPLSCQVDEECDPGAHCDGICLGDLADGSHCNEDSDCNSGHCNHGLCCAQGDCCLVPASCPGQYKLYPVCDDGSQCQGHRIDATCEEFVCGSQEIDDDSGCGWWTLADDCGPYIEETCDGTAVQETPACPVTCASDDNCDAGAHCDGSCQFDLTNGTTCDEDSDCQSGHCANGFCCAQGDCCTAADDCPALYNVAAQCDSPATCQGSRSDPVCQANVCGSLSVADDSACTGEAPAISCTPYNPVNCTGGSDQSVPQCPQGCDDDGDCVVAAHCDGGACLADLIDGLVCDEDSDCQAGHCANGFCCAEGDCCFTADDCPAQYSSAPICDEAASCQGSREDAVCTASACTTVAVGDDTACDQSVLSDGCGPYRPVYCSGGLEQLEPGCPVTCTFDTQCDADAHCAANTCQPDLAAGNACVENSDCVSGHCANGFCCAAGDCCFQDSDCPALYDAAPDCNEEATCQGSRGDRACQSHQCDTAEVDDDSACSAQTLADNCGLFSDMYCLGAQEQGAPQCPAVCAADGDCDAAAHCDGICSADIANGSGCDENSDCISEHCANGFCCVAGDCCAEDSDCPGGYTSAPVCDNTATCQGHRLDATCTDSACSSDSVTDDSGCGVDQVAHYCGFYLSIMCNGEQEQQTPTCPTSCASDDDCDPAGHCDGTCQGDKNNGQACDESSDCTSTHCVDLFCCNSACTQDGYACDVSGKHGQCWPE